MRIPSLRSTLIVGLLVANLLAASIAAYSLHRSHGQFSSRAQTLTQNIGEAVARDVSSSVARIDLELQAVTDELERQLQSGGLKEAAVMAHLARHQRRLPEIGAFRVSDEHGTILFGEGLNKAEKPSSADRDYFQFLQANPEPQLFISKPIQGRIAKKYLVVLARRYNFPDGSFAGEVHATLLLEHFEKLLSQFDLGKQGTLILRDQDLGLIVRTPPIPDQPVGQVGNSAVSSEFRALIASGVKNATYHVTNSPDGFERILTFRRLEGIPMIVITGVGSGDYLADWRKEAFTTVAFVSGFLLLSLVLGSFQLRLIRNLEKSEQSARDASVAKSRFLATMSHEIRTPMNGILGMAQLLQMPDVTEEERLEYAGIIIGSGQTLLTLLNDILDLSKIEADKVVLQETQFKPADLIHEIAALFDELTRVKGVQLSASWAGDTGDLYLADAVRIRQMLSNLVGNAAKFTPAGQIRIDGRAVPVAGSDDVLLEFAVTDSGIGIAPEKQDLLFKPFSQVDGSSTREYGGSGLGLSIVRNLAELMGGEVGIESATGKGSRFWFTLRARRADGAVEASPALRLADARLTEGEAASPVVLVAEDIRTNQVVIESMLRKLGFRYESAGDGQAAFERIASGLAPTLVLMDCQMPVLDGLGATRRIRAWEEESGSPRVPIIAVSASAYATDRQQCIDAGMDDFLAKPIAFEQLAATLKKWCGATV